LLDVIAEKWRY